MMTADLFEPNPRAIVGGNNPPDDDADEPTIEEARIVFRVVRYIQFVAGDLDDLLTKRKGGRVLGWRLAASNILKDVVRQNSARKLLGLNRKTMGENQQRCDVWADYDEEEGDGRFGEYMAALRSAAIAHSFVEPEELNKRLKDFVRRDPDYRKLEQQRREHELAAAEADRAAEALEQAKRERKALASAKQVAKSLKGATSKDAIVAGHLGPKRLANSISDAALAVVEKLVKAEAKGARRSTRELDPTGLKECLKLGLAREAIPHLAPRPDDPPIAPTELCQRVFLEAVELKRIKIKKKKAA